MGILSGLSLGLLRVFSEVDHAPGKDGGGFIVTVILGYCRRSSRRLDQYAVRFWRSMALTSADSLPSR